MFRIKKICIVFPSFPFILQQVEASLKGAFLSLNRALAPLRKIVARDIEVFKTFLNSQKPMRFCLVDTLECGHEVVEYNVDFLDLINAYTDNPHISAKRHRCRYCKQAEMKKPSASVGLVLGKAAGAA